MSQDPMILMNLNVNGEKISTHVRGGRRLLDFLRDDLHLTGTKEGCGEGECGACTVLLDGHAVLSCLVPIDRAVGSTVVTIEGIGTPDHLHPVQQALLDEGGVQCGMCTPGMVISAIDLLQHNPHPTRQEIIDGISGNLCRCTGYKKIILGIERAADLLMASKATLLAGNHSEEGSV